MADRILVLRDGGIVEEGTPSTLLANDGEYAAMNALYHEAVS
jgi:ABC-type multidrug transport system fused ATPase/permease subunit